MFHIPKKTGAGIVGSFLFNITYPAQGQSPGMREQFSF